MGSRFIIKRREGFATLEYFSDGTVKSHFYTFAEKSQSTTEAYTSTLFRSACTGSDDSKLPVNAFIHDCPGVDKNAPAPKPDAPFQAITTVVPGPEYKAGPSRRFFMGPLYRTSWLQPVAVPTLNLATEKGGLRPTGKGGGRQTTSLKLIAADSSEYVFRSVDKDVTRILPPELRNSFAAGLLRDITATANPYSNLPISAMLDQTDILHARPSLYRLPDNQQLGSYRDQYANLLGTLEDNPKDPKANLPGFGGADKVTRSYSFFRELYKNHESRIDAPAFAKARAFDMLVADFGKHEDNWKWAGYKQKGGGILYEPIPRDRDQAFTLWNGVLTYLANCEWAVPSIQDFGDKVDGLESLNWPARHLDRFLLQSLTRADWQLAAQYLQARLTPAVIDAATAKLPPEIQQESGHDINRKLKIRIQELPKALDQYYLMLAKRVDIVGSNENEVFLVNRQPDGLVRVQMFAKAKDSEEPAGEALFDRTFSRNETEEVCLYGLDGKDVFRVTGTSRKSILVRIIGGAGKDHIIDESHVSGLRTLTKVYDVPDSNLQLDKESDNHTSTRPDINQYDRQQFEYNGYSPRFTLYYNPNDRFTFGGGFDIVKQGFRKPGYKNRYGFDLLTSTAGLFQLTASTRHRYAIGKTDIGGQVSYGNYFPFYNFFGLGNNTKFDNSLYQAKYYRARYNGYTINAFLERTFLQRSVVRLGPTFEYYNSSYADSSLLSTTHRYRSTDQATANDKSQRLLGLNAVFDLDLRDQKIFARRGARGPHSA